MVFDRISLVKSYAALKIVELNDGAVKDILFNKTAYYGTKTILRFKNLKDLADFINKNYPFQYFDPNCQCAVTSKDAIWTPLSFNLTLEDDRYASFVNNLRGDFESAQEKRLNSTSVKACKSIFETNAELVRLKGEYSCFGYVANQQQYVNPCEYVELITNEAYRRLVEVLYPTATHPDLTEFQLLDSTNEEEVASVSIPELILNPPTYNITASPNPGVEGQEVVFTLTTTGLQDNIAVPFSISGSADGTDWTTTETANEFVVFNNTATWTITLVDDKTSDRPETLTLTLDTLDAAGNQTQNASGTLVLDDILFDCNTPGLSVDILDGIEGDPLQGEVLYYPSEIVGDGPSVALTISTITGPGSNTGTEYALGLRDYTVTFEVPTGYGFRNEGANIQCVGQATATN